MGPSRALRGWRRGLGFRAFLHWAAAAWRGVVAASSSDSGANPTPREWGEAKLGRKQAAWWRFRIKPPPPLPAGCCCLRRRLAGSARRSLRPCEAIRRVHRTDGNRSGLTGTKPARIQNSNLNLKIIFLKKISKNILRCDESNDVKFSQKFVHLV